MNNQVSFEPDQKLKSVLFGGRRSREVTARLGLTDRDRTHATDGGHVRKFSTSHVEKANR